MESSLSLHQHEAQEEEEKEMVTFMECDVYTAAEKGEINPVIAQRKDSLQSLLTPHRNTVLHIYLTSITRENPEPEINEFVERILGFCPALLMQVNTEKETLLHIAARYGHASIVNQLIKHAKEDHPDHNQDHENRAKAAKKMLRMTSKEGDTALHEAVSFGHLDVVDKLIAEDCDFKHNANKSGETPLYMAVQRGYNDIAKAIIERCDSPATGGPNGRNVLHAATILEHKGMIDYILNKMGEKMLKQGDQKGWTPLHYAADMENLDVVKTFLTKKMGREAAYVKNRDGNTALHLLAFSYGMSTMLEIIKCCPDSSELVNNKGQNVLQILQSRTSLSNLINEKDGDGNSVDLPGMFFSKNTEIKDSEQDTEVKSLVDKIKKVQDANTVDELKKGQGASVIVAALFATVTFTAEFTVPRGFASEKEPLEGTLILGRNLAFKTFMVMNTIAMVLYTSSVLLHLLFYLNFNHVINLKHPAVSSSYLTIWAMVAMMVAFATGTNAMYGYSISLFIVICVLALPFFIFSVYFLAKCLRRELSRRLFTGNLYNAV